MNCPQVFCRGSIYIRDQTTLYTIKQQKTKPSPDQVSATHLLANWGCSDQI